jgi:hypothetical protein
LQIGAPCAFEYAYDCDSLRLGEFGGGAAVITTYGVTHCATARLIHDALSAATTEPDEGDDGFVLAHRDTEHGLSFWNDASGYGRLALARVFTEEEAGSFVLPVQGDHTEWLAMPRRLA